MYNYCNNIFLYIGRSDGGIIVGSALGSTTQCGSTTSRANHAVIVVGWDTDSTTGQQYWIIRNQWGTAWVYIF